MTAGLLAGLLFGTPVALHLGYFWGTTFAALTGVEHDHRVEVAVCSAHGQTALASTSTCSHVVARRLGRAFMRCSQETRFVMRPSNSSSATGVSRFLNVRQECR